MLYADGAKVERLPNKNGETFVYMLEGEATLTQQDGKVVAMPSDGIYVVAKDVGFSIEYKAGGLGWLVTQTPRANEQFYGY